MKAIDAKVESIVKECFFSSIVYNRCIHVYKRKNEISSSGHLSGVVGARSHTARAPIGSQRSKWEYIYIYIQSRKGNRLLVKEEAISQLNYPLCEKKEPYVD